MTHDKALYIRWSEPSVDVIDVVSKEEAEKALAKRFKDNEPYRVLYAWYQDETDGKSYSLYSIDTAE